MIVKFLCEQFGYFCESQSHRIPMSVKIGPATIDTGAWYTDAAVAVIVIFALGAAGRMFSK